MRNSSSPLSSPARSRRRAAALTLVGALAAVGCGPDPDPPPAPPAEGWAVVHEGLPGALLSIWGTSATDVWAVGGDARDGTGPLVVHYDGAGWQRIPTGLAQGNLWWVFGFAGGPIFMGGDGGTLLRYDDGDFTQLATPGNGTVFGIWGASPGDVWAVGGTVDKNGFAWRVSGDDVEPEPTVPASVVADAAIWKMFGTSASDAWLVGSAGVSFHWDGSALTPEDTGVGSSLFTVHASGDRVAAVGGLATGFIVENDGAGFSPAVEAAPYGLTGVFLAEPDHGYAVGQYGLTYRRDAEGWREEDNELARSEDLHAVWIDPSGGVWAVGGRISNVLTHGVVLHKGAPVATGGL